MKRRDFLRTAGGGALVLAASNPLMNLAMASTTRQETKAIAFDAFPIFDPRPIFGLVKSTFPDHPEFGKAWFSKIFAYTWLRTSAEQYLDFYSIISQALDYTVEAQGLTMSVGQRQKLMDVWFTLKPWPDVVAALDIFEKQGIQLAFLSNFTEEMLRANARNGGFEDKFEYLSTDRAGAFKPDPKAYALGGQHFGLPKHNITFCAFAAWDAAGARWYGYPTVWVNRLRQKPERLDVSKVTEGTDIKVLTNSVLN